MLADDTESAFEHSEESDDIKREDEGRKGEDGSSGVAVGTSILV